MSEYPSIGIDLGTTNSAVAHAQAGELDIIPTTSGHRTVPSVVAYDGKEALIGRQAVNQAVQHPGWTIFSVKRYMGSGETILLGPNESEFLPKEISALILKYLLSEAEATLGAGITNAVITVPAYFSNRQREATKHAGEIAGIDVDRIVNEPTAACLAYGLEARDDTTIFVYDLGGGTFDASLIRLTDGLFEVVGTNGDSQLGGDDWDGAIVEWIEAQLETEYGVVIEDDPVAEERLFDAAQQAKHDLSNRSRTRVSIPFLEHGGETYDFDEEISRESVDRRTRKLGQKTITICDTLLAETPYDTGDIDEVLLVGGATRMPQIQELVGEYFHQQPSKRINPDEVVAKGAAAQSAIINRVALPSAPLLSNAQNTSVERERTSPPSEDTTLVLLDVTPQSLGTEVHTSLHQSEYDILIERNTSIPTKRTKTYTTLEDGQKYVEFKVFEGDHEMVGKNELLDQFKIGPLPKRPAGEPEIEGTFALDENGILTVSAEDVGSGVRGEIQITSAMNVSEEELSTMHDTLPRLRTQPSS